MIIKTISEEKASGLLREWSGQKPGAKMAEAERMFRAACDRYTLVEVENQQELDRLYALEEYLTGGHGFYLYLRCPNDVVEAIRAGKTSLPKFVHRAEERYSSACNRGTLKILIGILQEELDRSYDKDLFIDILEQERQPAQMPKPDISPQTGSPRQENRAHVVNYHFGRQVS